MKDLLYQYNPWWEDSEFSKNIIPREKYISEINEHLSRKQIIILTGIRRVGKTTLMKLIIKELINQNVDKNSIFYVSLDDYLLVGKSISEILTEYRRIHKLKIDEKVYLFFDEVTYKEKFQIELKNIYDNQNVKIFAASSSALILNDRKAYLTGRAIVVEVEPLDLDEYLLFSKIKIKKRDSKLLKSHFLDYIKIGGMPENVLNPNREYLMNLVDDIIQKDITAFHGLKNHQLLRDYFTLLMERSGKQISINKIGKILGISPDTSKRYLNYFQSTFLIYTLQRWGRTNQKILSPKKIYASDLGIKFLFVGGRDLGSYFENYVFQKLRSKTKLFYLYETGVEIDFYTENKILIEAKFYSELNEKQQKLFDSFPAEKKVVIDEVEKISVIDEIFA